MKTHDLVGGLVHEIAGSAAFVMTDDDRPAPSRPLSGCRLLVVEDDHIIRAALRSGLELHGSEVTAAADGVEALAHVMTSIPDVVVLDLALPRMNGEDFVAELRRRGLRRALRIVVVSADGDGEEMAQAMGADGYLRKPLRLSDLVREVVRQIQT